MACTAWSGAGACSGGTGGKGDGASAPGACLLQASVLRNELDSLDPGHVPDYRGAVDCARAECGYCSGGHAGAPPPPHDPPPGLPLGLASLLVSSAPPAPAVVPPGGAVLGARSLMDVLAAAPRGLMSLLSMSTQDDDNDDNGP